MSWVHLFVCFKISITTGSQHCHQTVYRGVVCCFESEVTRQDTISACNAYLPGQSNPAGQCSGQRPGWWLVVEIITIPAPRILEFHWRNFSPPRGWSANMQRLLVISSRGSWDPSVGKMTDRTNWEELKIFHVVKWHINCRLQNPIIFTVKTLI